MESGDLDYFFDDSKPWIEHVNNNCPVDVDIVVELEDKNYGNKIGLAGEFCWRRGGDFESRITRYRILQKSDYSEQTNGEFLNWIADRLVNVYNESPNIDFVQKLRGLASES